MEKDSHAEVILVIKTDEHSYVVKVIIITTTIIIRLTTTII